MILLIITIAMLVIATINLVLTIITEVKEDVEFNKEVMQDVRSDNR